MKPLRVGVVGVGHIGGNHARIYAETARAEFTAIYDIDAARAREVAAKFNVQVAGSLEEFAALIDAASVATPTHSHFAVARELLERGKHLLIEKPITETTSDAHDLARLAARNRLVLQVGHVERFNPVLSALEERLTHPRFIEAHRLSPYPNRSTDIGVVLDLMIHDLEIILHLVRAPVESIDAVGVPVLSKGEDIANARLRFAGGCVANITSSRISPERMRKIRVFQEDAYLSLDYQSQSGEIYRRVDGQIAREPVAIEKEEPLRQQLASFVECALSGGEPKVSGSHAAVALELAVRITEIIHENNSEGRASAHPKHVAVAGENLGREEARPSEHYERRPGEPGRRDPIHLAPFEARNRPVLIYVTVCTKNRRKVLASSEAHAAILHAWSDAAAWLVGRYIILPDHIHFFCAPAGHDVLPLERWMRYWKSLVTKSLRAKSETLWQRQHWDRHLRSGESYDEKWNYVRHNAVRHGLVADANDWPYQGEVNELRW